MRKKVEGVAYSGAPFRQWWSEHELITDLEGLEIPMSVPLLNEHSTSTFGRLGAVEAVVIDGRLLVSGTIANDQVEEGEDWQLSHGAKIKRLEVLDGAESATVNGRVVCGPIAIVRQATLLEVSVVSIGADRHTSMSIAACYPQPDMSDCSISILSS